MTSRRLGDISGRVREARKTSGGPRFLTFEGHLREFSSSVALAPLRLVVMSRDAWDPDVDDASVPLVGEFKYPVDRPDGPVVCSSRRVSVAGEPGMTKQIMRAAPDDAPSPPAAHATCFVHYDMWQRNETHAEVWSTRRESEPHQLVLGDATRTHEAHEAAVVATSGGKCPPEMSSESASAEDAKTPGSKDPFGSSASVPPPLDSRRKHHVALDACILTMRIGERARFEVPARLAYGETGSFSFPAVPPSCALIADVELIGAKGGSGAPEPKRADMLYEERISRVRVHRAQGNERYRAGDILAAIREYQMALSFLTDDMLMQLFGDYLKEAEAEKLPAHLNLAACFLREKRYREAIDQASRALGVDSTSAKAYYRRGRARQALGQDDDARADLLEATRRSPGGEDAAALRALRELETEAVKAARARKKTFGGLFAHEDDAFESSESSSSEGSDVSDGSSGNDDGFDGGESPRVSARKKNASLRAKRRAARAERAGAAARDAEARMNDVDEAEDVCVSSTSHDIAGGSTDAVKGVVSRLFKTLGFGR